jgi:hypothetical protein
VVLVAAHPKYQLTAHVEQGKVQLCARAGLAWSCARPDRSTQSTPFCCCPVVRWGAGSYAEVMTESALTRLRLVAATLPSGPLIAACRKTALQRVDTIQVGMIGAEEASVLESGSRPLDGSPSLVALRRSEAALRLEGAGQCWIRQRAERPVSSYRVPTSRLDQLMVIARFRELGFTQRRCESCTWCWAVWVDAEGNRIRSFRNVGRIAGVDYA